MLFLFSFHLSYLTFFFFLATLSFVTIFIIICLSLCVCVSAFSYQLICRFSLPFSLSLVRFLNNFHLFSIFFSRFLIHVYVCVCDRVQKCVLYCRIFCTTHFYLILFFYLIQFNSIQFYSCNVTMTIFTIIIIITINSFSYSAIIFILYKMAIACLLACIHSFIRWTPLKWIE